jgi:hypothetical protein
MIIRYGLSIMGSCSESQSYRILLANKRCDKLRLTTNTSGLLLTLWDFCISPRKGIFQVLSSQSM